MASSIRAIAPTGWTVYAHVMDEDDELWNGSAFEAYDSASWEEYDVALTEQGTSGIYVADFPSDIAAGTYEVFTYKQDGASPAETDVVIGSYAITWTGSAASSTPAAGSTMTGSEMYDYILNAFKRTDKETEVYEAVTDTIREIRRLVNISSDEKTTTTTDTIGTLGEYQIDIESDFNGFVSDVILIDGNDSVPLTRLSRDRYDMKFPNPAATNVDKGRPEYYCLFDDTIYIGPVPDSTAYTYRINYNADNWGDITSSTDSVPHSDRYREAIKFGSLWRLWTDLEQGDKAGIYRQLFDMQLTQIEHLEMKKKRGLEYVSFCDVV